LAVSSPGCSCGLQVVFMHDFYPLAAGPKRHG